MKRNRALLRLLAGCLVGLMGTAAPAHGQPHAPAVPVYTPVQPDTVLVTEPCCAPTACAPACERAWGSAEFLLWWVQGTPVPVPLLTTGPLGVVGPDGRPGTLGRPGTHVLAGDTNQDFAALPGGRFVVGMWLGDEQTVGVEGSYFFLQEQSTANGFSGPGTPGSLPLSIPYFNAVLGAEDSTGVALPRAVMPFAGSAELAQSVWFQGFEATGVYSLARTPCRRVELLAGFRYLNLAERLGLATSSINTPPQAPDIFRTFDHFQTDNDFYGGQLGVRAEYSRSWWFVNAAGKLGLGGVRQATEITGVLATNDFTNLGPVQYFPGGYLALPTNIGRHSKTAFAVVPEVNVNIGWQPASWLRIFTGYSFVYLSHVARPGDQIDRVINPIQGPAYFVAPPGTPLTGPARPTYLGRDSDFWAQGLNFGVELRY